MSIALVAHYTGPCLGVGQYMNRLLPMLVAELNNQHIQIKIVASPNAIAKTPALKELKELVYSLPPLDYSPVKRYIWVFKNFRSYCHQQGIQAVVWLSNPIVLPWHPPTLAVIQDVNEWKNPFKYKNFLKTTLRGIIYLDASILFAKTIVVGSKATEDDLLKFRPYLKLTEKIKTIANGIDSPLVNLAPVSIAPSSSHFLLSVGRIDPLNKKLPEAVTLVEELRAISERNWELHIVGGIEKNTEVNAQEFLNSIKDLEWCHYHGYVSLQELAEYYRRSIAVVFLSDYEGFGLPIAEASSFNRWTIVSHKNQAALESGVNSIIIVDPNHPQNAARMVLSQLQQAKFPNSNPQEIQKQGNTWEFVAKQYADEIKLIYT